MFRPKSKLTAPQFEARANCNPWLIFTQASEQYHTRPDASGFRTSQHRHAARHGLADAELGETFMRNTEQTSASTEMSASTLEFFSSFVAPVTAMSGTESRRKLGTVHLPEPRDLGMPLSKVLRRRKSVRRFTGDPISLRDVASIMFSASGISRIGKGTALDGGRPFTMPFRNVPSPGGLYPIDVGLLANKVGGLETGAYRYSPHEHALERVSLLDGASVFDGINNLEGVGIDPQTIAAVMCFIGHSTKVVRKYGSRGIRFMLLEAGMLAFAANLAATALGLAALDYQSYYDDNLRRSFTLDGRPVHVLHILIFGWADESKKGDNR